MFSLVKRDLNLVSCVENKGVILYIVCYFAYTIVPPINMIEPWFLHTRFFIYDIIKHIRELAVNSNIKQGGEKVMPAPKEIIVKDLATGQSRKFKSQFAADEFYGKKRGYF